uniref:TIL domain-containing protein n=1 Tax=Parastrongyloides trichosuri TaxID=131310 RepID=A0A0N4ZDI9_PARTI
MKLISVGLLVIIFVSTTVLSQLPGQNEGADCKEDKECWCYTKKDQCPGPVSRCLDGKCKCYPDQCMPRIFPRGG